MKLIPLIDEIKYCYDNNLIINYDKKGLEYYFMPFDSQELCLVDFVNFYIHWLILLEAKYEENKYARCPFSIEKQRDMIEDVLDGNIRWENRQRLISKYNRIKNFDFGSVSVEEVLDLADIEYRNWRCKCPFHWWTSDTSLSFKDNIFNCFGCWASGNWFKLYTLIFKKSTKESIIYFRKSIRPHSS